MAGTSPPEEGASVPSPPDGYRNLPVGAPQPDIEAPETPSGDLPDGGTLVVDFGALAAGIAAAKESATAAGGAADTLSSAAQRSGPAPWGDDPGLGQPFGDVFAEPRDAVVQAVQELPGLLTDIADNLTTVAGGFHGAQDDALLAIAHAPGQPRATT